jgi:protein-disulfide isomerase
MFFHELLPAALGELKAFNYFVVHDALYVPQKQQEAVVKVCCEEALKAFGAVPKFR